MALKETQQLVYESKQENGTNNLANALRGAPDFGRTRMTNIDVSERAFADQTVKQRQEEEWFGLVSLG